MVTLAVLRHLFFLGAGAALLYYGLFAHRVVGTEPGRKFPLAHPQSFGARVLWVVVGAGLLANHIYEISTFGWNSVWGGPLP